MKDKMEDHMYKPLNHENENETAKRRADSAICQGCRVLKHRMCQNYTEKERRFMMLRTLKVYEHEHTKRIQGKTETEVREAQHKQTKRTDINNAGVQPGGKGGRNEKRQGRGAHNTKHQTQGRGEAEHDMRRTFLFLVSYPLTNAETLFLVELYVLGCCFAVVLLLWYALC
jgi:hypothetical protein